MRSSLFGQNKKAIMGIDTLIIFIAMILVAAVAAGVVIQTSGVLQQRALTVGTEARERLVTGVDIVQILANANISEESIREFEILTRLSPGSYPVQMKTLGLAYTTELISTSATLQHNAMEDYFTEDINFTSNTSYYTFTHDIDGDGSDDPDMMIVRRGSGGDSAIDKLNFILSSGDSFNISLGKDISLVNATHQHEFDLENHPVRDESERYATVYGYLTIIGNVTRPHRLNGSVLSTFTYSNYPTDNTCDFDHITPETKFCYSVRLGDTDTVMEVGELMTFKYKLSTPDYLTTDTNFQFVLLPKRGAITTTNGKSQDVIPSIKVTLWP